MQVKAAVARSQGQPFSIEQVELDAPREKEVLVKVLATGVCHTDLVVRDGLLPTPLPAVLGHEGAGIVEQVGAGVTKVKPGDHVVMTFNSCGTCPSCEHHDNSYCHDFFPLNFFGTRPDGVSPISQNGESVSGNFFGQSSFATHSLCNELNVVKVQDDIDLALLGPLACGIQTGAGSIMNALQVKSGSTVAVFGTGSVGLSAIMAADICAATTIIAIDMNDERLELAEELGATHTINPSKVNSTEEIMKITGYGLQYALDTTGIPAVIRGAIESLAPKGTCGILGASGPDAEISFNETHFMSGGRRLMGIVEGESNPDTFIPELIRLHQAGRFPFDKLVTFYEMDQINQAIEDSEAGKTIKPIVKMS
ncbi:NAD(P)-dependent alcohol dehydrogenase [Marinomonas mediterranea]|jgi:Zn-dependent alcohol dehydrogenases, class III|uniref:Aryl-alcohol dehydrogenase n=1 Tax=Marinomonas mediterranea (strain ATCC 700492 / JCM 21426 / NBRC 103028 / MMB-1) TaxID=717774 RepID=F2JXP8_MARM1|nr:NAD(P)-dependent alcohol dehydrogenase [Marinomonas mediterranea]ADZ93046.1 Aryl-alcohol dehydrogenase [Marinomonas mediterranea MMB-1]WCN10955.1 alcohol dehydrogenase catalytic domain-containing protein [Marinomonas mediterranea]WCN15017.1 alcohol dehydrogenase catalytic domain-containing protein [Marinomonas mediterranea]WCN19061.1 alcohol dehydrogenase catalytic domain-containing protein [Marinomonas mediterranea MMB-1]